MHIGGITYEVDNLKYLISAKADKHELYEITSYVASLERTIGELSTAYSGLRYELQNLQEEVQRLREFQ